MTHRCPRFNGLSTRRPNTYSRFDVGDILACMKGYLTPHEVLVAIDVAIGSGVFKSCANLSYTRGPGAHVARDEYYPVCLQHSFAALGPYGISEGCPPGCRLFVDKEAAVNGKQALLERGRRDELREKRWHYIKVGVTAPFIFFRSLPALVQSLLIILAMMLALPRLKSTIIEILKAVSGR